MHHQYSENDENPLQLGVRLMWNKVGDASADAVLRAPTVHTDVVESILETETTEALFPRSSSQSRISKHLTFKKLQPSANLAAWNTPLTKIQIKTNQHSD